MQPKITKLNEATVGESFSKGGSEQHKIVEHADKLNESKAKFDAKNVQHTAKPTEPKK